MPTRLLRDGIVDSRAVNSLSDAAEIFYRRLFSIADDYGRFECDEELLRARLFARQLDHRSLSDVRQMVAECGAALTDDGAPLIRIYEVRGKRYLEITRFGQRQRTPSKFPPPPDDSIVQADGSGSRTNDGHLTAGCGSRARGSESEAKSKTIKHTCASADAHAGEDAHSHNCSQAQNGLPPVDDAPFDPVGGDGADWSLSPEQPRKDRGADRDAWFEEFWEKYKRWRATDKKRAKQVFLRVAKARETFNAILGGLDGQTPEMLRRPADKRPHASTWLNGERWKDELDGPINEGDDEPRGPRLMM